MFQEGNTIALEYSIYLANGTFVSTNRKTDPLVLTLGVGQLPGPLEEFLKTLPNQEIKRITLDMTPYFGPKDPHAHVEVPLEEIPENCRHEDGWFWLSVNGNDAYQVRVQKVLPHSAILDLNHPLAGQHALFELKIL